MAISNRTPLRATSAVGPSGDLDTSRRMSASQLSIGALRSPDLEAGLSLIREAIRREPLNPVHELRRSLLLARFGDLQAALSRLDRLFAVLPDVPTINYLRALFALRAGVTDKARAIAGSLETAHPGLVQGRFLRAEVQIVLAAKSSAAEKFLVALPEGAQWESLWCDLLVKLVLLHPKDGPAVALKYLEKKLSKDSRARSPVMKAMTWVRGSIAELVQYLAEERADSHGEALVLECLVEKLTAEESTGALQILRGLCLQYPGRSAVKRVYDAFLTRRAADLSAKGQQEAALRLAAVCLHDQPHDSVYYQNRAAIFTLLRESAPYHDAWAALNRHQYRLVLLGAVDAFTLTQLVKAHRLFAQQARGNTSARDGRARGIFRVVEDETGEKPRVVTNVDEIAADPDLLRQWIHHTRAELVFRHLTQREAGEHALLDPVDRDEALARAKSLGTSCDALRLLVPEEGAALADAISPFWTALAATVRTRYDIPEASSDASSPADSEGEKTSQPRNSARGECELLKVEHLQVLADLCLICLQWRPQYGHRWVAEEVLEFARAELAFFDPRVLQSVQKNGTQESTFAIQVLAGQVRKFAPDDQSVATAEQARRAVERCMAELLREMAWATYNGHSGNAKESATKALAFIDRARSLNPAEADIELSAAQLLSLGEYFEDSRQSLERFRRLAEPDNQKAIEQADKVDELLRERRKEGKSGDRRRAVDVDQVPEGSESRISELEHDLERCPSAARLYEELAKELALAGRFDEAVLVADRSVSQCLSRNDQMSARGLAIATRGIRGLAKSNPRAARLFAVGAHDPARKALEAMAREQFDYTLLYVLGRCELAAGLPEEARVSFSQAEHACDRQLHRTVLRNLAENIDSAYLSVARAALNDALQEGLTEEVLSQAAAVFPRLQAPEAWLVDFARAYYSVALSRVGTPIPTQPAVVRVDVEWCKRLSAALEKDTDAERCLALTTLAEEIHPPSAKQAQILAERARTLLHRIFIADTLNHAGSLLNGRQFAATLEFLDKVSVASESRLMRIRALALLGLRRFGDADRVVAEIADAAVTDVREFVSQYPTLVLRQRLAAAQELLRQGNASEATAALDGAVPVGPKAESDIAHCRAFALAIEGYERRRSGSRQEARACFLAALRLIEPHLSIQAQADQRHLSELYDRLEKEVESHE